METDRRAQQIHAVKQLNAAIDDAIGFSALRKGKLDRRHAILVAVILTVSALGGIAEWIGLVG